MLLLILCTCFIVVVLLAALDYVVRSIRLNTDIKFDGAHVLITGASSGIGLALAKKCAALGSHVTLLARNKMRLATSMGEVEKHRKNEKQQVLCVSTDICGNTEKLENSINEACSRAGPVDILVNCAGYAICGTFEDVSCDDFKAMVETNYLGSVFVTKCIAPSMVQRKYGHITFVSSIGGQLPLYGYSAYTPTKFAIYGLAGVLYSEMKPHNVGVSVVFPADTDTPGFENENKTKPEATRLISETSGLFSSADVAQRIIDGIQSRQYLISCGFDGYTVTMISSGTAPPSSLIELLLQIFLMGPLRLVMTCYLMSFDKIIKKCTNKTGVKEEKKEN